MATGITIVPQSPIKTFFKVAGFTAVTGVTTENITRSILIPADTIGTAAVIEITARTIKTGVAGASILRIYANTADSLSGATLLATGGLANATDIFQQASRTLFVAKGPAYTKTAPTTVQLYSDDTRNATTESSVAINWADPQYIILSIQNAAAGDSSIGSGIMVKTYK